MIAYSAALTLLAGCASDSVGPSSQLTTQAVPPPPAAERSTPVVAGRPARLHIAVAFDGACKPLALKSIAVRTPASKGDVTFQEGQTTVINQSASGRCIGTALPGTGVYYTAKAGAAGRDQFAVDIVLSNGQTTTKTFDVMIAE
jgi:hypothetical protein